VEFSTGGLVIINTVDPYHSEPDVVRGLDYL
jgi:hypothetical protein